MAKKCPKCGVRYEDERNRCVEDGFRLVPITPPPKSF